MMSLRLVVGHQRIVRDPSGVPYSILPVERGPFRNIPAAREMKNS